MINSVDHIDAWLFVYDMCRIKTSWHIFVEAYFCRHAQWARSISAIKKIVAPKAWNHTSHRFSPWPIIRLRGAILFDQQRNTTADDYSMKICLSDHSSMLIRKGNNCWVARVSDNGGTAGSLSGGSGGVGIARSCSSYLRYYEPPINLKELIKIKYLDFCRWN